MKKLILLTITFFVWISTTFAEIPASDKIEIDWLQFVMNYTWDGCNNTSFCVFDDNDILLNIRTNYRIVENYQFFALGEGVYAILAIYLNTTPWTEKTALYTYNSNSNLSYRYASWVSTFATLRDVQIDYTEDYFYISYNYYSTSYEVWRVTRSNSYIYYEWNYISGWLNNSTYSFLWYDFYSQLGSKINIIYFDWLNFWNIPPIVIQENCYDQIMDSWYSFNSFSILNKTFSDYTVYMEKDFVLWYKKNSDNKKQIIEIQNAEDLTGRNNTVFFSTWSSIEFNSFDNPLTMEAFISIATDDTPEYIKIIWSWNDFQLWVFSWEWVTQLLWWWKFFNYNEEISLKSYTSDIYAVVIYFEKAFFTNNIIEGIDYWTYETERQTYEICIDEEWSITRDGESYTWSLDITGDLEPLDEVGTTFYYTGTGGTTQGINDGISTFFDWINSIKNIWSKIIDFIKAIFRIWETTESKSWISWIITSANASELWSSFNWTMDTVMNWDNYYSKSIETIRWALLIICIFMVLSLFLLYKKS